MFSIYKLYSEMDDELVYYGKTTMSLTRRLYHHLHKTNNTTSKRLIERYGTSIQILAIEENLDADTASQRERFYIESYPCVNRCLPLRSKEQWFIDNAEYRKQYHKTNDKKRAQKRKERIVCPCGKEISKRHSNEHLRTKKHLAWAESQ